MFKYIRNEMIALAAVAGLLSIVAFGVFYFTRADSTIETVPPGTFPIDDSTEDGDALISKVITLIPKDAIPAILEPKFASPQTAENLIKDTEQVIGVSINGDARAYPIKILSSHEIVNDVVGGEPIAVTW